MRLWVYVTILCAAALTTSGCGAPSAASQDCEEFERLMEHVTAQVGAPLAATQIAHCEQRLETTSTRCQSAFRVLAECSRAYGSKPQMQRGECASEFAEQQTICNRAPAS